MRIPRFLLLAIIATAAIVLFFWSPRHMPSSIRQKILTGTPKAKECLKRESLRLLHTRRIIPVLVGARAVLLADGNGVQQ